MKIKELEWENLTEEYEGLETYKCNNALGWHAVYRNALDGYTAEYAIDEEFLFYPTNNVTSLHQSAEQAKKAAQEYHNKLVLSLLED